VASLKAALVELRGASYEAVIIDDPLPDGAAQGVLQQLHAARTLRPRVVRLVSFTSLTPVSAGADRWFDAEVTKPLRLGQLHAALSGSRTAGEDTVRVARLREVQPLSGRVLVVEDQPLNRDVAEGMLAALGLTTNTAADGQEALEKLARERFDAVLMDCEMPVMDGLAATRALSKRAAGKHPPVIALTADATPEGRIACLEAGMDDYLSKPFTREALRTTLARWLPAADAAHLTAAAPAPGPQAVPPATVAAAASGTQAATAACAGLLDRATLTALRALPSRGSRDMFSHIAEAYLADSPRLVAAIEHAVGTGQAAELARAAHAWRSCNGHVGALELMRLCRELEECGRAGDLRAAAGLLAQVRTLYARVSEELQGEMRQSA
jgi:CheY-like chemotaxis protein/HPt (histidine-containing phosphotransfer) domain-containing protein